MHRHPTAGFTLIELMIVIAILGLLAAVLLPNILGARDAAGDAATESTFLRLETACGTFERKHGIYPPADLKFPETESTLGKASAGWKPDNGKNTGIESLVAFVSQSRSGGTDFSDLGDKLCNTDKDLHGDDLPLLRRKDRPEIADAWNTPIAYFTKFTMPRSQTVVGFSEEPMECEARKNGDGEYFGGRKFQFVSAGKDATFGTKDDLVWPKN